MAKDKIKLSELKVKSYVTSLQLQERRTAKGGYVRVVGQVQIDYRFGNFTDHKSQFAPAEPGNIINNTGSLLNRTSR